jgi:hypothetical protein
MSARWAQALGGLKGLVGVNLGGCAGLGDAHLRCLTSLGSLRHLGLAECRGLTGASLLAWFPPGGGQQQQQQQQPAEASRQQEQPSCGGCSVPLLGLQSLDLSGTGVTDEGLGALSALPGLRTLSLARCAVGAAGLAALFGTAGPGDGSGGGSSSGPSCPGSSKAPGCSGCGGSSRVGASLRGLDLSRCCEVDDAALGVVASCCRGLRWLRASSCPDVGEVGLEALARQLPRLTRLEVAR